MPKWIPEDENAKRMELYNMGLSDMEIAKTVGSKSERIRSWRRLRGLPPNNYRKRVTPCKYCLYGEYDGRKVHCTLFDIWMERSDFCSYGEVSP